MKQKAFTPLEISLPHSEYKFLTGFTIIEVLIVVLILGTLACLAIPTLQGAMIKAKFSELFATVVAIEGAEQLFYLKHGHYASEADSIPGYNLPYTTNQGCIDNFKNILGVDVPGMDSIFCYGVYYDPAIIYVRVRAHFEDWHILCYKEQRGNWVVIDAHPWAKYLKAALSQ